MLIKKDDNQQILPQSVPNNHWQWLTGAAGFWFLTDLLIFDLQRGQAGLQLLAPLHQLTLHWLLGTELGLLQEKQPSRALQSFISQTFSEVLHFKTG